MGNRDRENDLIETQFTEWGAGGRPATRDRRRDYVLSWLRAQTRNVDAVAIALLARVQGILDDVQADVPPEERSRFFARVDSDHLIKDPGSILEKMARKWEGSGNETPPIGFHDFMSAINDLGRFRVVTNFLSDADLVRRTLAAPYDASCRTSLTSAQLDLGNEFRLQGNAFDDHIHVEPRKRHTGERCYKGHFELKSKQAPSIEVQIVTGLAEAWDKKDHFLIYEPRRRGIAIDLQDEIEIFGHSEMLYLADVFFDNLKRKISEKGHATTK